jgi:hypothetical protein
MYIRLTALVAVNRYENRRYSRQWVAYIDLRTVQQVGVIPK